MIKALLVLSLLFNVSFSIMFFITEKEQTKQYNDIMSKVDSYSSLRNLEQEELWDRLRRGLESHGQRYDRMMKHCIGE